MRTFFLAAAMAATALSALPATAQDYRGDRQDQRGDRPDQRADPRNDGRDHRDEGRDRRDDGRDRGDHRRDDRRANWQQYRSYDYNRYEPGQRTYYADRYYRDGR